MAIGVLMTKRNATMVLVAVMMVVVATASRDLQSESFELIIHSSSEGLGLEKLHACCPNKVTWNCYRGCRLKDKPSGCARVCDCKLVEEITHNCYRPPKDDSPTVRNESVFEGGCDTEAVAKKLHPCCENVHRWTCYRNCRHKGESQKHCAHSCSCVLVEKLTPDCYQPSMDSALLMMLAESDGEELKE